MSQDLSTLSAAQLKNIAKSKNIAYSAMASAKQMVEVLNAAGIFEKPELDTASKKSKMPKVEEAPVADEFEFREEGYEVCGNLKYNGGKYAKGDTVVIVEEDIARQLFADGAIK